MPWPSPGPVQCPLKTGGRRTACHRIMPVARTIVTVIVAPFRTVFAMVAVPAMLMSAYHVGRGAQPRS